MTVGSQIPELGQGRLKKDQYQSLYFSFVSYNKGNGYDFTNYFAKFEKFLLHSIILTSFMTVGSQIPELGQGRLKRTNIGVYISLLSVITKEIWL